MKKYLVALSVLAVVTAAILLYLMSDQSALAKVDFLNVGQGDAILLQAPSGQRVLIDAGPDQAVLGELAQALPFWAKEIDLAVVSHFHEDHTGGLLPVARSYRIKELVFGTGQQPGQRGQELLDALKGEGVNLFMASGRRTISLGSGCELELASPDEGTQDENDSLVASFRCSGKSWLFLGDATREQQEVLRQELPDWRAETVKISHHGSDDGLDEAWLKQLEARVAVIEVGQGNKYKHPSRRVLKKLERLGLGIRRTDVEGRISFAYGP